LNKGKPPTRPKKASVSPKKGKRGGTTAAGKRSGKAKASAKAAKAKPSTPTKKVKRNSLRPQRKAAKK
jgi:hypothetical protein